MAGDGEGAVRVAGAANLQRRLTEMQARLGMKLEAIGEEAFSLMELEAAHRFTMIAGMPKKGDGPYGIDTWAVHDSVTSTNDQSIRENHGMTLVFGTTVGWAEYLRKIGGPSGNTRGRVREGPNLVLQYSRGSASWATKLMQEYLMRGMTT